MFLDRKTNIFKISVLPNLINGFNAIPNKIPESSSVDVNTAITTFIQKGKIALASPLQHGGRTSLEGRLTLSSAKSHFKAIAIQIVWFGQKNRQINGTGGTSHK